ncbi:hypothetical protein MBBA_2270 [Methanoculleus bourgensis]|uniref:hypothetical protein n=1 Tax=Methanoculleus TaxID=45989 RepID=UPI0007BCB210|nr:hypothetical protein [Methanoculleus sp. UBA413]NQS74769.1 type II toxin-antitoxin system HicA family toxin [Methanoculleus sp.]SAI89113.1 hypothetical protein MBBA_2270 [Methanoculleus bourgensis]
MGTRKNRAIQRALLKKGFQQHNSKDIKLTLYHNGKKTRIVTWVSHGTKEISDKLIGIMAKQLKIEKSEFEDLVDCALSEQGLIDIYLDRGIQF